MLNNIFIFGAKYLFILSPILAGIFFLMQSRARQKKMLVLAAVAVPLTYVLVYILNHVYFDPRPFVVGNFTPLVPHIPDNGFPSDHTVLTALIASIVYPFSRKWSFWLFALMVVVAVSRVYVGIHHPIDVIGGALIAIVMTATGCLLVRRYTNKRTL